MLVGSLGAFAQTTLASENFSGSSVGLLTTVNGSAPWRYEDVTHACTDATSPYQKWEVTSGSYRTNANGFSGNYAVVDGYTSCVHDAYMVAGRFTATATTAWVSYKHHYNDWSSTDKAEVFVYNITDNTISAAQKTYTSDQGSFASPKTDGFTATGLVVGKVYSIAFRYTANNDYYWLVDDVLVTTSNDECANATLLTSSTSCSTTTGTTLSSTADAVTGACTTGTPEPVWYKFVAVATAHRVRVVGATGIDPVVGVITTCGTTTRPTGATSCVDASASAGTETLNLTGLTIGNTYYVSVHDYGGVNQADAFTICVTHLGCTTNTSPADEASVVNTATLTWNAVTIATSYDVYIGTSAATATLRGNVATTTSYTGLSGLGLVAGTYYWYVIPKNASGAATGCSSSATSFVLTPPSCPSLTSPTASQVVTTFKPTFTWVSSTAATSYDVYLGTSVASATLLANTTSTSYTTTVTLAAGTSYYWYVVAKNTTGSATGCSSGARVFTTMSQGSTTCATLTKLCTQAGQTLSFGATTGAADADVTNPDNDYGCLTTSPSPSWFYIEMATAGKLDITLQGYSSTNSTVDNDFILYGPFASVAAAQTACNTYTVGQKIDCSYESGTGSEAINIPTTATVGQIYVLLVTAYATNSSYFTLTQDTTSVGTTACSGVVGVCNMTALSLANLSASNDNGTALTTDDYYTADVTITYANVPATGTLDLSGAGIHSGSYSVAVGSVGSITSHTFTGVKIKADGSTQTLTATFSANTACTYTKSDIAAVYNGLSCAGKTYDYVSDGTTVAASSYCDDGTWNHYYDPASPTKLLFSINKNGLTFSPSSITIKAEANGVNYAKFAQDSSTPALTSWVMRRTWNVEVTADGADDFDDVTHKFTRNGTDGTKNVKVRFYYKPADKTDLQTEVTNFMSSFTTSPIYQEGSLWFKNTNNTALNLASIVEGRGIQNSVELTALDNQTTDNGINYVELSGIDGFSGGSFGTGTNPDPCVGCSPLPIALTSFTAVNNGASNKILWETASEQNTEWHVIEKSSDGIRFNDLGKVAAAGNSTSSKEYNMLDNTPFPMTYYRLRTIDFDGTVSHSAIVAVKRYVSNFDLVEVFPNPTDNLINARLTSSGNEEVSFKVVDALGRVVYQADKKLTSGSNTISIETSNFERAVYYLHITNSERNITVPFSKK